MNKLAIVKLEFHRKRGRFVGIEPSSTGPQIFVDRDTTIHKEPPDHGTFLVEIIEANMERYCRIIRRMEPFLDQFVSTLGENFEYDAERGASFIDIAGTRVKLFIEHLHWMEMTAVIRDNNGKTFWSYQVDIEDETWPIVAALRSYHIQKQEKLEKAAGERKQQKECERNEFIKNAQQKKARYEDIFSDAIYEVFQTGKASMDASEVNKWLSVEEQYFISEIVDVLTEGQVNVRSIFGTGQRSRYEFRIRVKERYKREFLQDHPEVDLDIIDSEFWQKACKQKGTHTSWGERNVGYGITNHYKLYKLNVRGKILLFSFHAGSSQDEDEAKYL